LNPKIFSLIELQCSLRVGLLGKLSKNDAARGKIVTDTWNMETTKRAIVEAFAEIVVDPE
jgi:hypothetical protein